jgi:hypothetical protein
VPFTREGGDIAMVSRRRAPLTMNSLRGRQQRDGGGPKGAAQGCYPVSSIELGVIAPAQAHAFK